MLESVAQSLLQFIATLVTKAMAASSKAGARRLAQRPPIMSSSDSERDTQPFGSASGRRRRREERSDRDDNLLVKRRDIAGINTSIEDINHNLDRIREELDQERYEREQAASGHGRIKEKVSTLKRTFVDKVEESDGRFEVMEDRLHSLRQDLDDLVSTVGDLVDEMVTNKNKDIEAETTRWKDFKKKRVILTPRQKAPPPTSAPIPPPEPGTLRAGEVASSYAGQRVGTVRNSAWKDHDEASPGEAWKGQGNRNSKWVDPHQTGPGNGGWQSKRWTDHHEKNNHNSQSHGSFCTKSGGKTGKCCPQNSGFPQNQKREEG